MRLSVQAEISNEVRGPELPLESNAAEDAPCGDVVPQVEISMDPARLNLDLAHSHLITTYWVATRDRGASRAVLFTNSPSAARTYEALGFGRVGDYSVVLFR